MNVVCFRYTRADLDAPTLNHLNKQIEVELQERGIAVVSIVSIRGKMHLHAAITNHCSRRDDLNVLLRE